MNSNINKYQLIIVIGLPGSGKTTYMKDNIKNHIIYDDFIPNFYSCKIIDDLKNNRKICISDPRLCDFDRFQKFMGIFTDYVKHNNILLILFKNEPMACVLNANTRNAQNTHIKIVQDSILFYATKYDLNKYQDYDNMIISVYNAIS